MPYHLAIALCVLASRFSLATCCIIYQCIYKSQPLFSNFFKNLFNFCEALIFRGKIKISLFFFLSSAKKSNTKSKIYKDYCRINTQEFLAYQARFTKHELRIIEGKQKMIENANEYSLAFRIRYLDAFLYNFYLRCMKGGARLLYKIRKGDWSEI